MTTDTPISNSARAIYLNEISEDYETTGDDPYPLALLASLSSPPGYRPPPTPPATAQPDDADEEGAVAGYEAALSAVHGQPAQISTYGLLRDRETAALLIAALAG